MTYKEQLLDPRWQKLRLEVFANAGFKCQHCDSETNQLHAHHLYYIARRMIWDYPTNSVICLCKDCHKIETEVHSCEPEFWEYFFEFVDHEQIMTIIDDARCTLFMAKDDLTRFIMNSIQEATTKLVEERRKRI